MKNGRGKAGSGGETWVAVRFGFFRGGFRDEISIAQPATQIDLPTAPGAKREVRPFGRISVYFSVANRAAYLTHRFTPPQTCGHARVSRAGYFFLLSGFAGVDGFAASPLLDGAGPSLLAGAASDLAGAASVAGFAASDSAFAAVLYDSLR